MPLIKLALGQRVRHPKYGEGTVKDASSDGAYLKVFFQSVNITVMGVNVSSLEAAGPPPVPITIPISVPVPVEMDPPVARPTRELDTLATPNLRRLTVECLRQGLPPPGKLTNWTVGNAKARRTIDAAIANAIKGEGTILFACAGYGQGKSHIGRLGCELARQQGLASFHVELDGNGISLAFGTRLVASLFASAQLPETIHDQDHLVPGLATLLKRAAPAAKRSIPPELSLFAPFLRDPQRWSESDEVIEILEEYISGFRNKTDTEAGLYEHMGIKLRLESFKMDWGSVYDRSKRQAEQLGRIVQLALMAGAKGAFIVIDELDHDFHQFNTERQNLMLSQLSQVVEDGPIVLLLLARELNMEGAEELVLGEVNEPELRRLVEKAIDAFAEAHPSPSLAIGRGELFNKLQRRYKREYQALGWGPRFFVRAAIECCETARLRSFKSLAQVEV